jgi:hypothetical protein
MKGERGIVESVGMMGRRSKKEQGQRKDQQRGRKASARDVERVCGRGLFQAAHLQAIDRGACGGGQRCKGIQMQKEVAVVGRLRGRWRLARRRCRRAFRHQLDRLRHASVTGTSRSRAERRTSCMPVRLP